MIILSLHLHEGPEYSVKAAADTVFGDITIDFTQASEGCHRESVTVYLTRAHAETLRDQLTAILSTEAMEVPE